MYNILFLGACDKGGLLLWLGKILASAGKRVLIIDATVLQKYQFAIPELSANEWKEGGAVIEFAGFDVASGFEHSFRDGTSIHESLETFFRRNHEQYTNYDCVLVDVDHAETLEDSLLTAWGGISRYVLVSNSERYTIQRNVELLQKLQQQGDHLQMVHIKYMAAETPVTEAFMVTAMERVNEMFADEQTVEFYYDERDCIAGVRMQYETSLKLKRLSRSTKKTLLHIVATVTDMEKNSLRLALKSAERGK